MARVPSGTLTLDLGTITGFAFGHQGQAPRLSSVQLTGRGVADGSLAACFCDWLATRIDEFNPCLMVNEAPLTAGQHLNDASARIAHGLEMLTQLIAWRRNIRLLRVHPSTVRAVVLGNGRAKKPDVVAWVIARGWELPHWGGEPDTDAADAGAIWAWAHGIGPAS